jgi:hypothetical protein
MHKETSKKSSRTDVPFPEGVIEIYFGPTAENNNVWVLGTLNLIETEDGSYQGAIQFGEKVNVIPNTPFPLQVTYVDDGIEFHVIGATKYFDQDSPIPPGYHFVFSGKCIQELEKIVLFGTGGVPADFCPETGSPSKAKSRPPTDPGEPVNWTSEGPGQTHHKHSK